MCTENELGEIFWDVSGLDIEEHVFEQEHCQRTADLLVQATCGNRGKRGYVQGDHVLAKVAVVALEGDEEAYDKLVDVYNKVMVQLVDPVHGRPNDRPPTQSRFQERFRGDADKFSDAVGAVGWFFRDWLTLSSQIVAFEIARTRGANSTFDLTVHIVEKPKGTIDEASLEQVLWNFGAE